MLKKYQLLSVFLISFFIVSGFQNIPTYQPEQSEQLETDIDNNSVVDTIELTNTDTVSETPIKQSDSYGEWQGAKHSANSTIEFNKQIPEFETMIKDLPKLYDLEYFRVHNVERMVSNDGLDGHIQAYWQNTHSVLIITYYVKIYCGGVGTFYYESYASGGGGSTTPQSGTYDITSSMLDSQGYTAIRIELFYTGSVQLQYVLNLINSVSGSEIQLFDETDNVGISATSQSITVYFDQLYFKRDTIVNIIRSEVMYPSPTICMYKYILPSVKHAKEIDLELTEGEEVSSITPTASYSVSSSTLTISSPTELTYEVLTRKNSSNILAVKDVSEEYLKNWGFEDGLYSDDFYLDDSGISAEISTDITHTEYYSVYLEHSASYKYFRSDFNSFRINADSYMLFSAYFVENLPSVVYFAWHDLSGSWHYEDITEIATSTNRWHSFLFYCPEVNYFAFGTTSISGTFKWYLDSVQILQTSTEITTTDYSQNLIESTFNVIHDSSDLVPYSLETINIELWDRCDQNLEYSYETTTDSNGIASILHNSSLEQKEYAIKAYSVNSYFLPSGESWTQSDWKDSGTWVCAGDYSESFTAHDNYLQLDVTVDASGGACYPYNTLGSSIDISNIDKFYIEIEFSEEETPYYTYPFFIIYDSSNVNRYKDGTTTIYDDSRTTYIMDVAEDVILDNGCDFGAVTRIYPLDFDGTANDVLTIYIYDIHFIHAVSYYFTPHKPTEIDFFSDAIDFTEGDTESMSSWGGAWSAEHGVGMYDNHGGASYIDFRIQQSIDAEFNILQFRIKANVSDLFVKFIYDWEYNTLCTVYEDISDSVYTVFTLELVSDWTGTENGLRIILDEDGGDGISESTDAVYIDFIRLVHIDEPELIETDTTFHLSSTNNTYQYQIYLDENYLGQYADLETIIKNNTVGDHNLTYVLYSAGNGVYLSETYSYYYTVDAEGFVINAGTPLIDTSISIPIYANMNYNYTTYENSTEIGTGSGVEGTTTIVIPRNSTSGFYNLTLVFQNGTETNTLIYFYSILTPPTPFEADLVRSESIGYFNFTVIQNQQTFWVNAWHDGVQFLTDSLNDTYVTLAKSLIIGWHWIYVTVTHERYFDWLGLPLDSPVNDTYQFYFTYYVSDWYKAVIRYISDDGYLAIDDNEVDVDSVYTWMEGELIEPQSPEWFEETEEEDTPTNRTAIAENRIWIKNTMPLHTIVITDLWNRTICNVTLDLSTADHFTIQVPIVKLGFSNQGEDVRMVRYKPTPEASYQAMELGAYETKYTWVVEGNYTLKVWHLENRTTETGYGYNIKWVEETWQFSLPYVVTGSIVVPLLPDDPNAIDDSDIDEGFYLSQKWWFWVIVGVIVLIIIWYIYISIRFGGFWDWLGYHLGVIWFKFGWSKKRPVKPKIFKKSG